MSRLMLVGSCPTIAGAMRSRMVTARSAAVSGGFAVDDCSMLLMPIVPSDAVSRTTTALVACLETPALVNVPVEGHRHAEQLDLLDLQIPGHCLPPSSSTVKGEV